MRRGGGQPQVGNYINQRGTAIGSNSGGGVPDGIKCQVCNKVKSKDNYAKRQLQKYNPYNKTFVRNPTAIKVTCKTCTPGQTTELHCYICDKTYGLDKFAKNQRKDPDKARCTKCVEKVLETEPDMSPPDTDEDEDEDEDTDNDNWETGPPKAQGPRNQSSRDHRSQHTASSANTGRNNSSSSSSTQGVPVYNHSTSGVAGLRSYAGSVTSSVDTSHGALSRFNNPAPSVASSVADGGGAWETVQAAGAPTARHGTGWGAPVARSTTETSSYRSTSASRVAPIDMKANGWAKIPKVHKGKEHKWGEGNVADYSKDDEEGGDVWAKYSRDIRDAKAGKTSKKKKKPASDSDDD